MQIRFCSMPGSFIFEHNILSGCLTYCMKKMLAIIATAIICFAAGQFLMVAGADTGLPVQAALWGAVGTAVLLYWPRRTILQLLSLCWLCIVLYGVAGSAIADCRVSKEPEQYLPSSGTMVIFFSIPFLLVLVPIGVFFIRSAYRDHMRSELEEAVLAATDPLHGPEPGAMQKACRLLARGTRADYIPEAMVARDELFFEAVGTPHKEAVDNAVYLIPLLGGAGATINQETLQSAGYNCPPAIQAELNKLPLAK